MTRRARVIYPQILFRNKIKVLIKESAEKLKHDFYLLSVTWYLDILWRFYCDNTSHASNPPNIYLFKVNKINTRKRCGISWNLTLRQQNVVIMYRVDINKYTITFCIYILPEEFRKSLKNNLASCQFSWIFVSEIITSLLVLFIYIEENSILFLPNPRREEEIHLNFYFRTL